tara:strand:+ start:324 stop:587 length:264 start_codon:yes stop_codon:yes gene_type:complete
MSKVETNNEIRIFDIDELIRENMNTIKHCSTRAEAEEIQEKIKELEEEKAELEQIESEVCPECGSYENEWEEDAYWSSCLHEYHEGQ